MENLQEKEENLWDRRKILSLAGAFSFLRQLRKAAIFAGPPEGRGGFRRGPSPAGQIPGIGRIGRRRIICSRGNFFPAAPLLSVRETLFISGTCFASPPSPNGEPGKNAPSTEKKVIKWDPLRTAPSPPPPPPPNLFFCPGKKNGSLTRRRTPFSALRPPILS